MSREANMREELRVENEKKGGEPDSPTPQIVVLTQMVSGLISCDLQGRKVNFTDFQTSVWSVSRPAVTLVTLACVSFHFIFLVFCVLAFLFNKKSMTKNKNKSKNQRRKKKRKRCFQGVLTPRDGSKNDLR